VRQEYHTKAGSRVIIDYGSKEILFDWFEEENACCECGSFDVIIYYAEINTDPPTLNWNCDDCGLNSEELFCGP